MFAFSTTIAGWADLFFFFGCICMIIWVVIQIINR